MYRAVIENICTISFSTRQLRQSVGTVVTRLVCWLMVVGLNTLCKAILPMYTM